jgi:4-amino-4-deoxy-L-arabinose transferase-like glycosyltransferase
MRDKNKKPWFHFIILLVAVVPLFALGLSNHGLWWADEPRVAEIGREMAFTGNWAVPTLNPLS